MAFDKETVELRISWKTLRMGLCHDESVSISVDSRDTIREICEKIMALWGVNVSDQLLSVGQLRLGFDSLGKPSLERMWRDYKHDIPEGAHLELTDFTLMRGSTLSRIEKAEHRLMSLESLQRVHNFIKRGCDNDGNCFSWYGNDGKRLQYCCMNLYHLNDWVIVPSTYHASCSLVEALGRTEQVQGPSWFVSHWWGEEIEQFLKCIMEHCDIRSLSASATGYWICAFANNQHELGIDIVDDPLQTSFYHAMQQSAGVLCVLDDVGMVFQRVWCAFELSTAISKLDWLLLDFATATGWKQVHRMSGRFAYIKRTAHSASIITDGLTPNERFHESNRPGSGVALKTSRESHFPLDLISKGLQINIEDSKASKSEDRNHILNCIAGRNADLNSHPIQGHPSYESVNVRLRSLFAMAGWREAVTSKQDILPSFSTALREDVERTVFSLSVADCRSFDDDRLVEVADALHPELIVLDLNMYLCVGIGDEGLCSLARSIPPALKTLKLNISCVRRITTIGITAVAKNFPSTLKCLDLECLGCVGIDDQALQTLATHMPTNLKELTLLFSRCTTLTDRGVIKLLGSLPGTLRTLRLSFEACRNLSDLTVLSLLRTLTDLPQLQELGTNFRSTAVTDFRLKELHSWQPAETPKSRVKETAAHFIETSPKSRTKKRRGEQTGHHQLPDMNDADHVWSVFSQWDKDGNGKISIDELAEVFKMLDPTLSDEELFTTFAVVDQNKDSLIDFEEFVQWLFQ